jgi:hypothetical protein
MNTERIASVGILVILTFFVVLHALILLGIVPFQMVWGGRLTDYSRMIVFESVSLVVNLLMILVVLVQTGLLHLKLKAIVVKLALWAMAVLFGLNTLGNALSNNALEKSLFTPLTLLLCFGCLRLALSKGAASETVTSVK